MSPSEIQSSTFKNSLYNEPFCDTKTIVRLALAAIFLLIGILAIAGVNGLARMGNAGAGALIGLAAIISVYPYACNKNSLKEIRNSVISEILLAISAANRGRSRPKKIEISLLIQDKKFTTTFSNNVSQDHIQQQVVSFCHQHVHSKQGDYEIYLIHDSHRDFFQGGTI